MIFVSTVENGWYPTEPGHRNQFGWHISTNTDLINLWKKRCPLHLLKCAYQTSNQPGRWILIGWCWLTHRVIILWRSNDQLQFFFCHPVSPLDGHQLLVNTLMEAMYFFILYRKENSNTKDRIESYQIIVSLVLSSTLAAKQIFS